MSEENIQRQEEDPRLTAYVLGELDEAGCSEVEELLEQDPEAARIVAELRTAASAFEGLLGGSVEVGDDELRLRPEQRRSISAAAHTATASTTAASSSEPTPGTERGTSTTRGSSPAPRSIWRRWQVAGPGALAAAAVLLVAGNLMLNGGLAPRGLDVQTASAPAASPDARPAEGQVVKSSEGPPAPASRSVEIEEEVEEVMADLQQLEALGYASGDSPFDSSSFNSVIAIGGGAGGKYGGRTGSRARRTPAGAYGGAPLEGAVEEPSREGYRPIFENDFQDAKASPLSTFAVDVDSASYANVRRILREGRMPPADAVRIEELVNYFPYGAAAPGQESSHPVRISSETVSAPWRPQHRLLRISLATRPIAAEDRSPSNLVFLLDVSGSMNDPQKLPLIKRAFSLMVQQLDERDRVSIVVYAGAAGVVLEPTGGDQQSRILDALDRLEAGGSTNGGAGIHLAYDLARSGLVEGGTNRVILATDGDFNVGTSDDGSLVQLIQEQAESGVFLTILGFGSGNLQDSKLEQIANRGNGTYGYVDSLLEARRLLVEQLGATLETVAKDVKLQVEFNPNTVAGYRLLGYENRLLAAQDFADDSKDGGEMGAGHRMTALYEVVPAGLPLPGPEQPDLKYQGERLPTGDAFSGELCTVKVRYKEPAADTSVPFEVPVRDEGQSFGGASEDTRFAAAVASFAMLLRDSSYAGEATLEDVLQQARGALGDDPGGYRTEFLELVERARAITAEDEEDQDER